jgi:hypothetical protein
MWVCLSDAFFSIVDKDCARDELLVRARRKGDIEKVFPGAEVRRDGLADYLYRAAVKRRVVAETLAGEAWRIAYPNFKDSVRAPDLHRAYMRVWTALADLQPTSLPPMAPFGQPGFWPPHGEEFFPKPVARAPKRRKYKKRRQRSLRRGR